MNEAEKEVEQFQRTRLAEVLAKCTEPQKDLFKRLYPHGPTKKQLTWATQQCLNTIKGNEAGQAGGKQ